MSTVVTGLITTLYQVSTLHLSTFLTMFLGWSSMYVTTLSQGVLLAEANQDMCIAYVICSSLLPVQGKCFWLMLSHFSRVWLCATLWTVAHQAPLSMGFSRQEYWSGLLCPPPGELPDSGIKLLSPALTGTSLPLGPPGKPHGKYYYPHFTDEERSWGSERLISLLSYSKSPSFPTLLREDWQGMVF